MHIVIDIPEVLYEALRSSDVIISGQQSGKTLTSVVLKAVGSGVPLPTGHGRLIDADELLKEKRCFEKIFDGDAFNIIHEETVINAHTIIEADKENER